LRRARAAVVALALGVLGGCPAAHLPIRFVPFEASRGGLEVFCAIEDQKLVVKLQAECAVDSADGWISVRANGEGALPVPGQKLPFLRKAVDPNDEPDLVRIPLPSGMPTTVNTYDIAVSGRCGDRPVSGQLVSCAPSYIFARDGGTDGG